MKILLVEDNIRLAETIEKILVTDHFLVDKVVNGKAAVLEAEVNEYDLVILDWMLPDIEGIDVCRQIREKKLTMPILLLTAKSQLEDKVEGLNAGADDYLTKPFEVLELLARVRALLRRQYRESISEISQIADLEVDHNKYQVSRAGKKIELSAKEFSLLDFLVRNKSKAVSRTEILEHVWESNTDSMSNVVDVYIRMLRRKIDDDYPIKLIKTVKNIGYQLCEN
jgi:DNA-binding response OmpR family regulator